MSFISFQTIDKYYKVQYFWVNLSLLQTLKTLNCNISILFEQTNRISLIQITYFLVMSYFLFAL